MAGAMAMIKSLCGGAPFRRSRSKASKLPKQKGESNSDVSTSPSLASPPPPPPPQTGSTETRILAPPAECHDRENMDALEITKELPLPPAMQMTAETTSGNNINDYLMKKSASTRSLSSISMKAMSMKLPRSMSMARKEIGEDKNNQKKKGKLKHEDSVWMKTIILGEKCKVPDEEEAVIYDGKGKRISTYHKKASSSFASMSRQNSQIDLNEINSFS